MDKPAKTQVSEPRALCTSCREPTGDRWCCWTPTGALTCSSAMCVGWARSRGWQLYCTETPPAVRYTAPAPARRRHTRDLCAACRRALPGRKRERFTAGGKDFCTLTCMEAGPVAT